MVKLKEILDSGSPSAAMWYGSYPEFQKFPFTFEKWMMHTGKPMVVDMPDLGPMQSHWQTSALNTAARNIGPCASRKKRVRVPAAELGYRCVRMCSGQKYKWHFLYINHWGLKSDPWAPCGHKNHCPSLPLGPGKFFYVHSHPSGEEKGKERKFERWVIYPEKDKKEKRL